MQIGVKVMTDKEITRLLAVLEGAYPRQNIEDKTIKAYTALLRDLDFELASKAVAEHIRESKWFPTVAEIRERCVEMAHYLPTSEVAMELIRMAVRTNNYKNLEKNDLMRQAVATVGFDTLGRSELPEPLFRQVENAYKNLRAQAVKFYQNKDAVGHIPRQALGTQDKK